MPLRVLELGKHFRPATSSVYPPFKNGRYMEEYFYEYALAHKDEIDTDLVYIPIFWTNLQIHPAFQSQKHNYDLVLSMAIAKMPPGTKYFTVVQHDDGPLLKLPKDVVIFGACTGTVPLPLIYEDKDNILVSTAKTVQQTPSQSQTQLLASFVGSNTHPLRTKMNNALSGLPGIFLGINTVWTSTVSKTNGDLFIQKTLESKFCLAPRGYGRSSFRFFEAIILERIPVYFWNDVEWLPYKEQLDYSKFAICIQEKDIPKTYEILKSISDETYTKMLEELKRVKHKFSLEEMSKYICSHIKNQKGE